MRAHAVVAKLSEKRSSGGDDEAEAYVVVVELAEVSVTLIPGSALKVCGDSRYYARDHRWLHPGEA